MPLPITLYAVDTRYCIVASARERVRDVNMRMFIRHRVLF